MLEAIYRAAGYRVGRYGSPHLVRFNERASIDGQPAGDAELAERFAASSRPAARPR
jgi:dihydrofolate synthase / folylpolyglutamate synthase